MILLKEEVFARLSKVLADACYRDLSRYACLMDGRDFAVTTFSHLEDYLEKESIPFYRKGVSLESFTVLPSPMTYDYDDELLPSGIMFIHPDTEWEIILFIFQYVDGGISTHGHIACYKDGDAYEDFSRGYREYCGTLCRTDQMIFVYDGHDLPIPALAWDDIVLPEALKEDIKGSIEGFLNGEALYRRLSIPYKRGLLLAGPPGNGKTLLLKIVSSEYRSWKFIYFHASSSSDNGDIDGVFRKAREMAPSIVCFEDIDSLFRTNITLSHFLNKLDGFEDRSGTLILATTNHPEDIDPALTSRPSRFDRVWVLGNPDLDARRLFIGRYFNGSCQGNLLDQVAQATEGFSNAYLKELYISASILAINAGKEAPGEEEIFRSLEILSSQVEGARRFFADNVRAIGFGLR